jgi:hypothetical protein
VKNDKNEQGVPPIGGDGLAQGKQIHRQEEKGKIESQ